MDSAARVAAVACSHVRTGKRNAMQMHKVTQSFFTVS